MTRDLGDKLGPKLSRLIADTVIATKKGLLPTERRLRVMSMQDVIDRAGREVGALYSPLLTRATDNTAMPDHVREHLAAIASGEHQWQAVVGATVGLSGAGSMLSTILSNYLAPTGYTLVQDHPFLRPDVGTMAALAARRIITSGFGAASAAGLGYDSDWFTALEQSNLQYPDSASMYAMINRGLLPAGMADYILEHVGFPDSFIGPMKALAEQILAPADAALATLRGNITNAQGEEIARQNGISAADFAILVGNTGEPPGVMDMLSAYRRGFIDEAELTKAIRESRVRDEWIPTILKLRYQPMTTADAIDAAVQNHVSLAEAQSKSQENGLEPSDFDALYQTAGEPLSKVEMLRLHRMGKVTVAEVEQALRESRLKDKYIAHALELTTQIPPLFTIRSLLTAGAISDAEATHLMQEDGYEDNVITAIVKAAHKTKTVKVRTVTEGMLSELYAEQAIAADTFISELKALGYSAAEADQIKEIDDWRIAKTNRDAAIGKIRSGYLSRKLTETEAQNSLHMLLVPAAMVDKLMADWDIVLASTVKLLTEAQIVDAWYLQLLTVSDAMSKLTHLGYSEPDATLLLEIKNKGPLG